MNPRFLIAHRVIADVHLARGRADSALAVIRSGLAVDPGFTRLRTAEVRVLAAAGRADEARARLRELEAEAEQRYVRAEELAQARAALGDTDAAFRWLERAFRERSAGLLFLNAWPAYDPLRSDPRFAGLLERVGLPVTVP